MGLKIAAISYETFQKKNQNGLFEDIFMGLGKQRREVIKNVDKAENAKVYDALVCSTILRIPFNQERSSVAIARRQVETHHNPQFNSTFVTSYECAGWGYALNWALKNHDECEYFMISIIDHGIYPISHFSYNPEYGKSRFGSCVVLLKKDAATDIDITLGTIKGNNLMASYLNKIRILARKTGITIAFPFFPKTVWEQVSIAFGDIKTLKNKHETWGHCFGSDPWISMATENHVNSDHLITSLALNGYYCAVKASIDKSTYINVKT